MVIYIAAKKYFFIVAFCLTGFVQFFMMKVYPLLCMRLEAANVPFPEDKQELKDKIDRLAIRIGYNNSEISLIESKTGDLHSNASTTQDSIKLS